MSTYERCKVICDRERRSLWEYLCFVLVPLKRLNKEAIEIADSHGVGDSLVWYYRINATGALAEHEKKCWKNYYFSIAWGLKCDQQGMLLLPV